MLSKITAVAALTVGTMVLVSSTLALANPPFSEGANHHSIQVTEFGVPHISTVPANAGDEVQIAVRELVAKTAGNSDRVPPGRSRATVLFIHGASVPGEAAFDFNFNGYSWARYLANAGFDVFIMDFTGYGFSPRPEMANPCNASTSDQLSYLIPNPLSATCSPDYPFTLTNVDSEHDEIDAVVDFIRAKDDVQRVNLIAWSLGGLRAGTYAALHPDKIEKIVFYASCCYSTNGSSTPPSPIPAAGVPMQIQSYNQLINNRWLSNSCPSEIAPGAPQAAWNQIMRYDPLGSTWGTPAWNPIAAPDDPMFSPHGGLMRYPSWQFWGWNAAAAQQITVPTLVIDGDHDGLYNTNLSLYADLGAADKVFVGVNCATHFAVWERQHIGYLEASRQWLTNGTVDGMHRGMVTFGTDKKFHKQ